MIINKFRGDVTLLHSGIEQIEALTGVPVLGVMPWLDVDLEDEDGIALQRASICALTNAISTSPLFKYRTFLTLLISMRLLRSRMCACAMFASLKSWRGRSSDFAGQQNTLGDLVWLRESGMANGVVQLHRNNVPVVGICGGYQMLGDTIIDEVESGLGTLPGLGLLNTVTHFAQHKTTTLVEDKCLHRCLTGWRARRGYPFAVMKFIWAKQH